MVLYLCSKYVQILKTILKLLLLVGLLAISKTAGTVATSHYQSRQSGSHICRNMPILGIFLCEVCNKFIKFSTFYYKFTAFITNIKQILAIIYDRGLNK
jgi:hypothetical protein